MIGGFYQICRTFSQNRLFSNCIFSSRFSVSAFSVVSSVIIAAISAFLVFTLFARFTVFTGFLRFAHFCGFFFLFFLRFSSKIVLGSGRSVFKSAGDDVLLRFFHFGFFLDFHHFRFLFYSDFSQFGTDSEKSLGRFFKNGYSYLIFGQL